MKEGNNMGGKEEKSDNDKQAREIRKENQVDTAAKCFFPLRCALKTVSFANER